MTKNCPKCGSENVKEAKFCNNCGYNLDSDNASSGFDISSMFKNGKIFIILIAIVLVIGGIFILTSSQNNITVDTAPANNSAPTTPVKDIEMIITEASAHYTKYDIDPDEYSLTTYAMFENVPASTEGYLLKTTYYDTDDKEIGQVTEKLSSVLVSDRYVEDEDTYYFGEYNSYKKIMPSHVVVELTKDGKLLTNGTCEFDLNKINYLADDFEE
jgi:hypothetical protein